MTIKNSPPTDDDLDAIASGDVREWAKFDIEVHNAGWTNQLWYRFRGNERKDLGRRPSRPVLAEAACHGNGHMREAAVKKLARSRDPEALPLLLVRCVDWVAQVRDAARDAAMSKLDEPALRAMLPLIAVLSRRGHDTWMTDLLRRALLSDTLLEAALSLEDRQTRRWIHDEAIRTGRLPLGRLTRIALRDNDLVIRTKCGLAVLDRGDTDAIRQVADGGTAVVRTRALTLPGADIERSLTERTSLVRSMAQAMLLKAGGDPAAHYRALLADSVVTHATVAGLGETGDRSDVDLLLAHLTAELPRVRGAAVRGLGRLTPDNLRELFLPLLTDPSPYVVRHTVTSLHGAITKADEPSLFALLALDNPPHVRRGALSLLRAHDSWTRLLADLRLIKTADPLADDADEDFTRWCRESTNLYTKPTPEVAEEIRTLLGKDALPDSTILFLLTRT
jgi:hypothetical protein